LSIVFRFSVGTNENRSDGRARGPNGHGQMPVRDGVRRVGQLVTVVHLAGGELLRSRRQLAERYLHHKQTGRLGILDRYDVFIT